MELSMHLPGVPSMCRDIQSWSLGWIESMPWWGNTDSRRT